MIKELLAVSALVGASGFSSIAPKPYYGSDQPYLIANNVNSFVGQAGYTGSNVISFILPFVRQTTNYLMPDWDSALSLVYDYDLIDDGDYSPWTDLEPEYNFALYFQTTTNNFVQVNTCIVDKGIGVVVIDQANNQFDNLGLLQWSYANGSTFSYLNSGSLVPCNPLSGSGVVGSIRWYSPFDSWSDDTYNDGYDYGYYTGNQDGYTDGYTAGRSVGFSEGVEATEEEAYLRGRAEGENLKRGLLDLFPNMFASVTALIYSTSHIQILGISLFEVISLIVSLGILAVVLKVFLK